MLYFVATPIGNLKDISFRAVEVLKSVDEIACEDTRHSLTLLSAYDIKKPLFAYHKFNEREECERIIEKLKSGKNIAVITDAATVIIQIRRKESRALRRIWSRPRRARHVHDQASIHIAFPSADKRAANRTSTTCH